MTRTHSAIPWTTDLSVQVWASFGLLTICGVFFIFTYNSGYGYDALEYLVVGRSMAEGVPFYTYQPSKSPGIYYLVAWLHEAGIEFDHLSLSAFITTLYAGAIVATFAVARRWFTMRAAYVIALLTALAAPFMEMNFLQPTILFYVCGLAAFDALLRFEQSNSFPALFAAGIALGAGIAFKSAAAFYGLAAGFFLILLRTRRQATFSWLCKCGVVLAAGAAGVIAALIAYYAIQGTAGAFLEWTFIFPFAHYPSSTTFLAKAYTKLLWVHLLIVGCIPLLFSRSIRAAVSHNPPAVLALMFGACAYLALMKTQASHYFFPGVPFLFMFAVSVYGRKLQEIQFSRRSLTLSALATALLMGTLAASVAFYRPDAAKRLISIKNFELEERPMREFVQSRVNPGDHVLITGGAIGSTWTYWISHRYPPPPFVTNCVKTIWALRHRPHEVFGVLDDPKLALVQFEMKQLEQPVMEDVFGDLPEDRAIMRDYLSHVRARFEPVLGAPLQATFWQRQSPPIHESGAAVDQLPSQGVNLAAARLARTLSQDAPEGRSPVRARLVTGR